MEVLFLGLFLAREGEKLRFWKEDSRAKQAAASIPMTCNVDPRVRPITRKNMDETTSQTSGMIAWPN